LKKLAIFCWALAIIVVFVRTSDRVVHKTYSPQSISQLELSSPESQTPFPHLTEHPVTLLQFASYYDN